MYDDYSEDAYFDDDYPHKFDRSELEEMAELEERLAKEAKEYYDLWGWELFMESEVGFNNQMADYSDVEGND